jgi:hypothetical protein
VTYFLFEDGIVPWGPFKGKRNCLLSDYLFIDSWISRVTHMRSLQFTVGVQMTLLETDSTGG